MSVLLMYVAFGTWLVSLVISMYATYRLFEYGPFNANLAWELNRKVTDIVTCIALGVASVPLISEVLHWTSNYWLLSIVFAVGFLLARVILIFVLRQVASPYLKREREKRQYTRAMTEAEIRLRAEGLYPKMPTLDKGPAEWEEFGKAIEVLRSQGKFPPVPKWMEKDSHEARSSGPLSFAKGEWTKATISRRNEK